MEHQIGVCSDRHNCVILVSVYLNNINVDRLRSYGSQLALGLKRGSTAASLIRTLSSNPAGGMDVCLL
jgi:hypothetical protein